jgi:anti-sigma factor RsiW
VSAGHLSFDELAELAEGLFARRQARAAEEHLTTCEECGARAATLRETTTALRDLGPVSMPADVAARLDRTLASAADEPAGDTVVPDLSQVRRRRQTPPPWTIAAAAAVVLIAAGSTILATRGGHHSSENAGAAATGQAPLVATTSQQPLVTEESGRIYTPTSLAALAPGLVSGGSLAGAPTAPSGSAASGGSGTTTVPLAHSPQLPRPTATSARKNAIAAPPPADATRSGPSYAQELTSGTAVPAPLRRYAMSQQKLLACAAFITDTPGAAPLAVDYARWTNPTTHARRTPALILVFSDPQDSSEIDVYVVAPACDDSSLLDFQLLSAS